MEVVGRRSMRGTGKTMCVKQHWGVQVGMEAEWGAGEALGGVYGHTPAGMGMWVRGEKEAVCRGTRV